MKRTVALLTAALLAAGFTPKTAQAAGCAGVRPQSIFGTVQSVNGPTFALHTNAPVGDVIVHMPDNDVNRVGGATLRPGVYAGVWGCLPSQSRDFIAEKVTLSPTAATYPAQFRYSSDRDEIYGRIDQVQPGRILVHATSRRDTWVVTKQSGFATGQTVRVSGYYDGSVFVASNVAVVR